MTDAGLVFLGEARQVLEQSRRAAQSVRLASMGERGRLRIAFVTSSALSILPRAVREFKRAYPNVDVDLKEMNPASQIAALARRDIDVGLLRTPLDGREIVSKTIFSEPLVIALPSDHRLAHRRSVPLESLAAESFILFPRHHGPGVTGLVLDLCRAAGFSPRIAHEPDEMTTILAYVASGFGVSLVPASLMSSSPGLIAFRSLRNVKASIELALAWSATRKSVIVENFNRICLAEGKRCRQELKRRLG